MRDGARGAEGGGGGRAVVPRHRGRDDSRFREQERGAAARSTARAANALDLIAEELRRLEWVRLLGLELLIRNVELFLREILLLRAHAI